MCCNEPKASVVVNCFLCRRGSFVNLTALLLVLASLIGSLNIQTASAASSSHSETNSNGSDRLAAVIKQLDSLGSSNNITFEIGQLNITDSAPSHVHYIFNRRELPKRVVLGQLTRLILRGCNLTRLPNNYSLEELLQRFPALKTIDLGRNNLTTIGWRPFDLSPYNLSSVKLDNNMWSCNREEEGDDENGSSRWLLRAVHSDKGLCERGEDARCYQPEALRGMTLSQALSVEENSLCQTCHCYAIKEALAVNCSGRGLGSVPPRLPLDTRIVILSDNSIGSLDVPIDSAVGWESVLVLDLNNNTIDSFDGMKEPQVFGKLRTLHVKQNRLTEIPIHILDQLVRLDEMRLGNNPWQCDCNTVLFKEWISKINGLDADDIKCADDRLENNVRNGMSASSSAVKAELAGQVISRIAKSELCPQPSEPIEYLDVISGVLAVLTVLIVLKLTYDWRWQKRTGKLPRFFKINI